jgi:flagellin-like protein
MTRHASDEAVSAVVATILMVAVTVILAATVFLIGGRLTGNKQESPAFVSPARDETGDRLTIIRADPALPVSRLQLEASVPGHFGYNALASLASPALPANTFVPLGTTGIVKAGDILYFCANTASSNVQILIQDPVTNRLVDTETFQTLAACA